MACGLDSYDTCPCDPVSPPSLEGPHVHCLVTGSVGSPEPLSFFHSFVSSVIARVSSIPKWYELQFFVALVREANQIGDGTLPTGVATDVTPGENLIKQIQFAKAEVQLRQTQTLVP